MSYNYYLAKSDTVESSGAGSATARSVLEEWRPAHSMGAFRLWLGHEAPSDDSEHDKGKAGFATMSI